MKLEHIVLDQLKPSPLNVRKKGSKDVGDLTASIRSLGLLQPLLVRSDGEGYAIIAGQRRYNALAALAEDGGAEPVPCIVMEEGDDAKAIETSLAENIARLPMDEIDQFKAFAALRKEGLAVADIAVRFGVTERLVEQRLAIAGIIPPILTAYRKDKIDAATLRTLTMATPRQQKAWWTLFKGKDTYAPTGRALKDWLFGGNHLPVSNALFDVETYDGAIVADLFGEEHYFADSDAFWTKQGTAIAERQWAYFDAGWLEVEILNVGQHFAAWNHRKVARTKGGKVFIAIAHDGEVTFHEGYLTYKEADRTEKKGRASASDMVPEQAKPERSELTSAMKNYLGLHRHAAVCAELLGHRDLALRLVVAHMVAGSPLWRVEAEPQRADNAAIAESLSQAKARQVIARDAIEARCILGLAPHVGDHESDQPIAGSGHARDLARIFETLTGWSDDMVMCVLTTLVAETLAAHSPIVDMLGTKIGTDMRQWWTPDQTFFDLLRDKEAINAMLGEVAGKNTADAHVASTAKVQKKIIADCLTGNGRPKTEGWLPHYMAFPAAGYTSRFGGDPASSISSADAGEEADIDTGIDDALADAA